MVIRPVVSKMKDFCASLTMVSDVLVNLLVAFAHVYIDISNVSTSPIINSVALLTAAPGTVSVTTGGSGGGRTATAAIISWHIALLSG